MGLFLTLAYMAVYYLSPPDLFPALAPYRIQLIVSAMAMLATLVLLPGYGYPWGSRQNLLVLGFFSAVVSSRVAALWLGGALAAIMEFGSILVVFFLLMANAATLSRLKLVSIVIAALGLYYATLGMVSLATGFAQEKYLLEHLTLSGPIFRIRGVGQLSDPNDMAQFFLVAVALLGGFWKKGALLRNFVFVLPPMMVLLVGTFQTRSRGALLALAMMMFVWLWRRVNPVLGVLAAAGTLVILLALNFAGGRAINLDEGAGRLMAWGAGIDMFKNHPLFGVGWQSFTEFHDLTSHNSYILCLAELGTYGFFFWSSMLILTLLQLNQFIRQAVSIPELSGEVRMALSIRLALVAFLTTSWFLSRTYVMTPYVLVAMGTLISLLGQQRLPAGALVWPPSRRWGSLALASQLATLVLAYVSIRARGIL